MRILLDECVPRRLRNLLQEHDCLTVQQMGWGGKRNGVLLALANREFDLLLTADHGYEYQQNVTGLRISVVILGGKSNTYESLAPLVPAILEAISGLDSGVVVKLS
jgi:predicted nuclease of predicted toxin-antitoxin system